MRRRVTSPSPPISCRRPPESAFLLIEAGLAAVAIAVGLVAISRGLGSSLSALASLQRRGAFLSVAESTLQQLRAEAQQAPPLPSARRRGSCGDDVRSDCEWELTSEPFNPPALELPGDVLRLVTVSVHRSQGSSGRVRLQAVWPADWLGE